jgi:hypothetical protein
VAQSAQLVSKALLAQLVASKAKLVSKAILG